MVSIVQSYLPYLQEVNETKEAEEDGIIELDGPNSKSFYVTWEEEDGRCVQTEYTYPWDERNETIMDLLKEAAHPTGRTIRSFDPPVVNGIEIVDGKNQLHVHTNYYGTPVWKITGTYQGNQMTKEWTKEEWDLLYKEIDALQLVNEPYETNKDSYIKLFFGPGYWKQIAADEKVRKQMIQAIVGG